MKAPRHLRRSLLASICCLALSASVLAVPACDSSTSDPSDDSLRDHGFLVEPLPITTEDIDELGPGESLVLEFDPSVVYEITPGVIVVGGDRIVLSGPGGEVILEEWLAASEPLVGAIGPEETFYITDDPALFGPVDVPLMDMEVIENGERRDWGVIDLFGCISPIVPL